MKNILEQLTKFACSLERPLEEIIRQYLLETILRRLIISPLSGFFILRGGMLMRMWVSPKIRPADDLDFLVLTPYDLTDTINKVKSFLSLQPTIDDGVVFDVDSVEGEGIWIETPSPGARITMKGTFEGNEFSSKIDVGFGDPLTQPPIKIDYPTFISGSLTPVVCQLETAFGWKLHGLVEFGEKRWRAKDLYDLFLLVDYVDQNSKDLSEAIKIAFSSRNTDLSMVIAMFESPTWWTREKSLTRWKKFLATKNLSLELSLLDIISKVKNILLPIVAKELEKFKNF